MNITLITAGVALSIPWLHLAAGRLIRRPCHAGPSLALALLFYLVICVNIAFFLKRPAALDLIALGSTALFCGLAYLEAFFMIGRGFSLHILIAIFQHGSLSLAELDKNYGGGKGIAWLLNKRLANLRDLGLIEFDGAAVRFRHPLGPVIAWAGLIFKRILKMSAGG